MEKRGRASKEYAMHNLRFPYVNVVAPLHNPTDFPTALLRLRAWNIVEEKKQLETCKWSQLPRILSQIL